MSALTRCICIICGLFIIFPQVFSDSGLEEEYINESEIIPILSETQDSMDEIVVDINDPEVNTPPESGATYERIVQEPLFSGDNLETGINGYTETITPPSTGDVVVEAKQDDQEDIPTFPSSGGDNNTLTTLSSGLSIVKITELFPKDTALLGEYVILTFFTSYNGEIRIGGLGASNSEKSFLVSAGTGMRVVVTDTPEKITNPGLTIIPLSSITLTDTGEPLVVFLGSSIDPVDKVVYETSSSDKALLFGGETDTQGYRVFSVFGDPSGVDIITAPPNTGGTTPSTNGCAVFLEDIQSLSGQSYLLQITLSGSFLCATQSVSRQVGETIYIRSGCAQTFFASGGGYLQLSIPELECTPLGVYLPETVGSCTDVPGQGTALGTLPKLEISEIHAHNTDEFPEYIELLFHETFSGTLTIEGLGQGAATKTVEMSTSSGSYIVITDTPEKFSSHVFLITLPSISLTDNGEKLVVYSNDGQNIDSIVYSGHSANESVVAAADNNLSGSAVPRPFTTIQSPTPGFAWGLIAYLFTEETDSPIPVCGIDLQHTTPIFSTNKVNLQATIDGAGIANSSSVYTCERLLTGSDNSYFTGCNPSFIGYNHPDVYTIALRIREKQTPVCDLNYELNLPMKSSGSASSQNATSTKQSTYYEGLYRKRKGRFDFLKDEAKALGYSISTSGEIISFPEMNEQGVVNNKVFLGDKLRIVGVVADPIGRDIEGETMQLENLTNEPISTDDLVLVRDSSTHKLPEQITLPPHQTTTMVGNLGLTNRPTCISVRFRSEVFVLSTFCYPQPREGILFTGGLGGIETPQDSKLLSTLQIDLQDAQVCVVYEQQELLCKQLPFLLTEAKKRKKEAKKTFSLEKKITTLQEKYDLRRDKYTVQSKNFKTKESSYLARARVLRSDVHLEHQSATAYRSLFFLLKNELIGKEELLLGPKKFAALEKVYTLVHDNDLQETISRGPLHLSPTAVQERYDLLETGKLPLQEIPITEIISYLRDRSSLQVAFVKHLIFDF